MTTASFKAPKLVIFDLDGTLVEFPKEYIFSQTHRILGEFDHPPVERAEMELHFSRFDLFKFVRHDDREGFIERYWSAFDWDNYPKPVPLKGSVSLLQKLKAMGLFTALATARLDTVDKLRADLAESDLLPHLDHLLPRAGEHIHWTDKTGQLLELCDRFGVSPAEAMFIGDIPSDVISARKVGLGTAVAVLSGGIVQEVLAEANPDFILPHAGGILDLFE